MQQCNMAKPTKNPPCDLFIFFQATVLTGATTLRLRVSAATFTVISIMVQKIWFKNGRISQKVRYHNGVIYDGWTERDVIDFDSMGRLVTVDARGRRDYYYRAPRKPYLSELRWRRPAYNNRLPTRRLRYRQQNYKRRRLE